MRIGQELFGLFSRPRRTEAAACAGTMAKGNQKPPRSIAERGRQYIDGDADEDHQGNTGQNCFHRNSPSEAQFRLTGNLDLSQEPQSKVTSPSTPWITSWRSEYSKFSTGRGS